MKKLLYLFLILSVNGLWAQTITPQVINSAGMRHVLPSGLSVTDNVGEPFTTTIGGGPVLTQGFIQPLSLTVPGFTMDVFVNNVSCLNKDDGKITTTITATTSQYDVKYIWTPTTVCPTGDCESIDSLKAGNYGLQVVISYTNLSNKTITDTLNAFVVDNVNVPKDSLSIPITDVNGLCRIKVFNGVTMNNDGINDVLTIENIAEFPNNRLTIYNRWGVQLFDQRGYDNITKFWPTADDANKLVSSTYFYILDLGDGTRPLKGWVELIKN